MKTLKTLRTIAVTVTLLAIPALASADAFADSEMAAAKAERQKILSEAKERFENEKRSVQEAVKSGKMNRSEAREAIIKARETNMEAAKAAVKAKMEAKKAEMKERLKNAAKTKMQKAAEKFAGTDAAKRTEKFRKVLAEIDRRLAAPGITEKQKALLVAARQAVNEAMAEK